MMSFRRTTFDNVGGLKSVKTEIKNSMIGPLLKPEFSKKFGVEPPKGIILFGPPVTAHIKFPIKKTFLARRAADFPRWRT